MAEPYYDVIAQARNGSGKTGSFSIGSLLRVDPKDPKLQVLVIVNTRELVNQIHSVYEKLIPNTGITLGNFNENTKPQNVCVTTHGKLEPLLKGRTPLDLSSLKCIVIDEADVFFLDEKNFKFLEQLADYKPIKTA